MIPVAFLVALAAATLAVLVIAAVAVARELNRLGRTLLRFQADTRPYLEQIQRSAQRAAERMERIRPLDGGAGDAASAEQASQQRREG